METSRTHHDPDTPLEMASRLPQPILDPPPLVTELDLRVEDDLLGMYFIG